MSALFSDQSDELKIAWWNAGNFYHFEKEKISEVNSRWPQSKDAYDHKLSFSKRALEELISLLGRPDVFFFCEITSEALTALRNIVFPGYRLISLDVKKNNPTLQVGVLINGNLEGVSFVEQPPITVPATPAGTRPMVVLDAITKHGVIRLIGCHWQSRFDEQGSQRVRYRLADYLSQHTFEFLVRDLGRHHIIVVGDLNDEPFDENLSMLYAHRHRVRSKGKAHWTDANISRAHLYNTSWRLLGEKFPHPRIARSTMFEDCAGTFYWESAKTWHHFDHIIVSGGLLHAEVPYLDENELHVVSSPSFLKNGLPLKFGGKNGSFSGLSDHLPVVAKIII